MLLFLQHQARSQRAALQESSIALATLALTIWASYASASVYPRVIQHQPASRVY